MLHNLSGVNVVADSMGLLAGLFAYGALRAWAARASIAMWCLGLMAGLWAGLVVFWYAY